MHRDPRLYLDDILDAIAKIQEYTSDFEYSMFAGDRKTQDAVVRNLEIIGEAAGRLPDTIKDTTKDVEWRKIVGLRNILVHEYFGISLPVVWDIIQNKLGALEIVCQRLIKNESFGQDKEK